MASIARRPDGTYRPRYRDENGKEHARHFDRKVDAQRWLDEQTVALVHGNYVHPERSRLTVGEWAETWLAGRSHLKPKTLASYRSLLSTRDLPRLPTTDRRYLTRAQLPDLAEHCGPHRLLVLGYTGLRWGEAAALRVRRVDLLRGRIEVAESVTDVDGRMVFGPPKSHAQRRVPVPRFLRDDLAVQLAGLGPDDPPAPPSRACSRCSDTPLPR